MISDVIVYIEKIKEGKRMKIEKINDRQIRCTLTGSDLKSRQIQLGELAHAAEDGQRLVVQPGVLQIQDLQRAHVFQPAQIAQAVARKVQLAHFGEIGQRRTGQD